MSQKKLSQNLKNLLKSLRSQPKGITSNDEVIVLDEPYLTTYNGELVVEKLLIFFNGGAP